MLSQPLTNRDVSMSFDPSVVGVLSPLCELQAGIAGTLVGLLYVQKVL